MEGYVGDEESRRESQGEWSQNSEWMQEMAASIFSSNQTFSQMLHGPNLLPSHFNAFRPPPIQVTEPMFNYKEGGQLESPMTTIGDGIFEGKEVGALPKKQVARKKMGRPTKE